VIIDVYGREEGSRQQTISDSLRWFDGSQCHRNIMELLRPKVMPKLPAIRYSDSFAVTAGSRVTCFGSRAEGLALPTQDALPKSLPKLSPTLPE
jgi:hypothetical protein